MTETPLDQAHAAMMAAPDSDVARMRFYDCFATTELFVLLTAEPEGDVVTPEVFDLADARFAVAFDREERLSAFAARAVPYAALSGRALAQMLEGAEIGVAVNIEVAPSAILLPPEALGWLAETLRQAPREAQGRPRALAAPKGLPPNLLTALDAKLASAAGLARQAYLAHVRYDDGRQGHLLAVIDVCAGAEAALAGAVQEALVFSGLDAAALDVVFLDAGSGLIKDLTRVGLRFDLPEAPQARPRQPIAPGMDPAKPPRLT